MHECLLCSRRFKNGAGLAAHRRAAHQQYRGPNRLAAEEMLAELKRGERLTTVDVARVQSLRSLADQLDTDPSNAQMWRTYREVIDGLCGEREPEPDALDRLLEEINGRTPVGNPAPA
jgi:hypothetical protein